MIDVIIPVYNCEKYIINCIDSIRNQSIALKINIIDDASVDASSMMLKRYKSDKVSIYLNKRNEGNLKTVNSLLGSATAKYIAFQDADDWSHIDRLSLQIDFLEKENLDFCFTNFIKTDVNGKHLYCGNYKNELITKDNVGEIEPSICFASILFKRKIYEEVGGFDDYFNRIGGADIDWLYRIVRAGFKGGILKSPLYFYRNNHTSYTSTVSLDPRKSISVEIARYLYRYRLQNKGNPKKQELTNFISEELRSVSFSVKNNLKDYIVQKISQKKFLIALYYLMIYLLTKPFTLKDIKLAKYFLHKIINGN